ncbi:hypothetical protein KP612_03470 [Treponema denticola]|uniref:Uncharacterized protein n=1 Tax=Treponema denticola H-22 TaxID=999432 RepID=A0A0E2EEU1_TREDN|nr:hypothetical protein [Treponema denticola]EMB30742.1 hypothetical protein HMPREF9726_02427 [Treponema denticola H-22]
MFFRDHDHSLKSKRRQAMEENEELNHLREEANLEKGDVPALIIAAITTLLPIAAVIVLAYYLISMFIFG